MWAASPTNAPSVVNGVVEVSTAAQLQYLDQNQTAPIDASSSTTYLNATIDLMSNIVLPSPTSTTASNWVPFGHSSTNFTGIFNGQGYTVSNLIINDSTNTYVGFFGVNAGLIENLVLQGAVDTSTGSAGLLTGSNNYGTIDHVLVEGSVEGTDAIGGLAGLSSSGTIQNAMSTATVSESTTAGNEAGGLIGASSDNTLSNVAATGSVTGSSGAVGGLIGVSGYDEVTNAYASGAVTGSNAVEGGFMGIVGVNDIADSYFDPTTTEQSSAVADVLVANPTVNGITAETTSAMQQASTYQGWNFTTVWNISSGINNGFPTIIVPTLPGPPTLTTVTPGAQQLTVQWTAPAQDGNSPITGYVITATPTTGTASPINTSASASATTTTLTGVTDGVTYTVTLQAVNAVGSSPASNSLSATAGVPETVPSAPLSLQGTAGNGTATLNWLPPIDTGNTALTTSVVYATYGSGANAGAFTQSVPANVYSAVVPNLTNGTPYTFTVVAENAIGASPASNAVTVTPVTVPNAPSDLTGTAGNGQVTLQWTLPTNVGGSALTATAVYGTSAQGDTFVEALGPTTTSTTVTSLTNGVAYTFTVNATNSVGASVYSNAVTLTPGAPSSPFTPPPLNLKPPALNPTPPLLNPMPSASNPTPPRRSGSPRRRSRSRSGW